MAAVGIQIGSAVEGSPPGSWPGSHVACNPVERDRRWPRLPAREGAAGMWIGGEGGGRDSDWQRG